ncbi:hypothetical protein NC653_040389 [Populus alba x Populus x berolinensis]|uniref:Uncharacterized protein n=1 Tax=Populus alba x Populus x berolinensis TaxID=444605 RepID=A0AAD6LDS4_9ROSI|nr:hypothetical protein NC653_040389 [Populus alba x Populus x berolinensis]
MTTVNLDQESTTRYKEMKASTSGHVWLVIDNLSKCSKFLQHVQHLEGRFQMSLKIGHHIYFLTKNQCVLVPIPSLQGNQMKHNSK